MRKFRNICQENKQENVFALGNAGEHSQEIILDVWMKVRFDENLTIGLLKIKGGK